MANEISTGSLLVGLQVGTDAGVGLPDIMKVRGNPSGLIVSTSASGICIDTLNGSIYMAAGIASVNWIALGSAAY